LAKKLTFDPAAKSEIQDAARYYEEVNPGLGKAFLQEVELAVRSLHDNPLRWRPVRGPFRRCLVARFPYYIIFVPDDAEIYIAAVMHRKRRPDYWADRAENR